MPKEIKLLCNNCFQPLDVCVYDIGTFVNTCSCRIKSLDNKWNVVLQDEVNTAEGDGYDRGYDIGYDRGYDEGDNDTKEMIDDLKKKLEKYDSLIEDDEYLDRLGT